jgi:hypothetical protein
MLVKMFMAMFMLVVMVVLVMMLMLMSVAGMGVKLTMLGAIVVAVAVLVVMCQMNIKLHTINARLLAARDVEMVAIEAKFFQFLFEPPGVEPEVQQRADEHIAADAAENIEV